MDISRLSCDSLLHCHSNDSLRELDSRIEGSEVADEVRGYTLRAAFQEETEPEEEEEDNVSVWIVCGVLPWETK